MTEKKGNIPSVSDKKAAKKEVRRLLRTEKKLRKRLWEESRQYRKYNREKKEGAGRGDKKGKERKMDGKRNQIKG